MRFKLNVTPLKDAMNLCIISSNISKFFEKSTVIQLTAEGSNLRLNTQATSLLSEVVIKGDNEDNSTACAIVDNSLFKSLISSLDVNEVTLDFQDTVLEVKAGRSKFNVPKLLMDEDGICLDRPILEENLQDRTCSELHPSIWKYIQEHQLYAVASNQIHKVYTYVWVDSDKGVLTGDPNMSFFTYQPNSDLGSNCLISNTIVNLLAAMEEGTQLYMINDTNYLVKMNIDSFSFCSQFTVEHEDETGIGIYDSDMIFDMVLDEYQTESCVSRGKLSSNIKQAQLFASSTNSLISVESNDKGMYLVNDNVNCRISKDIGREYSCSFNLSDLDIVVSHIDEDNMTVSPIVKEEEVFGLRFKSGDMVALVGGVE